MTLQPWKTFRYEQPSNFMVQNILQYQFDQIFEPGTDDGNLKDLKKKNVNVEDLIKSVEEPKISKEEENTLMVQMDILRGINSELSYICVEMNRMYGLQFLAVIITMTIHIIMFGYFFIDGCLKDFIMLTLAWLVTYPILKLVCYGYLADMVENNVSKILTKIIDFACVESAGFQLFTISPVLGVFGCFWF